jgi:hypothetical protein
MSKFLVIRDMLKEDRELTRTEYIELMDLIDEHIFRLESDLENPYEE